MTRSDTFTPVRCVSILLALLLLLSVIPFRASATGLDDSHIAEYTLTGSFDGNFKLSSQDGSLFDLHDIIPGDKWVGKIHIKNKSAGQIAVSLKTITSDIKDQALFDALALNISYQGKSIYSGSYNTGLTEITKAYVIDPNKTLTLDVEVSLPVGAGNEVQGRIMDSTWTFEGTYTDKPQTGANLFTENTLNLYVLWVLLFAAAAAAIVILRIRAVKKMRKAENSAEQSKEVNNP